MSAFERTLKQHLVLTRSRVNADNALLRSSEDVRFVADAVPDELVVVAVSRRLHGEQETGAERVVQSVDQLEALGRHGQERRLGHAGVPAPRPRHVVLQHNASPVNTLR